MSEDNKTAQFDQFFSINYPFNVNATIIETDTPPSYQSFMNTMPMPFKMASEIITLDQAALRPLQTLGSVAGQLVDYLHHQAKKIDLLVSYILSEQDNEMQRYQGTDFGGGGVIFTSNNLFNVGQFITLKIFLLDDNCAIYCCGEIISATTTSEEVSCYKVIYHHIREEDREILVRCSLHQQSKQLQILAQQRNNQSAKDK
ncbi:PilZ domain-containing protein [Colwellia hornerae]|uniref:PilZ domain-containing protein n=1 Tax=Colwellia hornerae TaxID=89402 RepID=A0A5C6Q474_9GAMM|nr:PilZ domain-containing protein [Colwellia hornerae]TWX47857.1 PilZ domain-containing protein [Colwellia hornerae]TWX54864.1 PilZ domain-containing protein [Colwellia hornerae]TWX63457.1 PilZ domain-containing protein [Colwellia hornerae]